MNDDAHTTHNAFKPSEAEKLEEEKLEEEKLLVCIVPDEAVEQAAGGTPWPPAHPGTGVATICVRDPSIP